MDEWMDGFDVVEFWCVDVGTANCGLGRAGLCQWAGLVGEGARWGIGISSFW